MVVIWSIITDQFFRSVIWLFLVVVVPTDGAKLMILFQPKLAWSLLELLGRSADSGFPGSPANIRNKRIDGDRPLPLRCLGQFFPTEEKINCLGNEFFVRTFHRWGDLVFIMGDHDNFLSWMMIQNDTFPCWMMIRYFSHWVRDFISLSLTN